MLTPDEQARMDLLVAKNDRTDEEALELGELSKKAAPELPTNPEGDPEDKPVGMP